MFKLCVEDLHIVVLCDDNNSSWFFSDHGRGLFGNAILPQLRVLELGVEGGTPSMVGIMHVHLLRFAAPNAHIVIDMQLDINPLEIPVAADVPPVGSLHVATLQLLPFCPEAVASSVSLLGPRVSVKDLVLVVEIQPDADSLSGTGMRQLYDRIEALNLRSVEIYHGGDMEFDVQAIMALPSRSSASRVTLPACTPYDDGTEDMALDAVQRLANYPRLTEVTLHCGRSIVVFEALTAIPHSIRHIRVEEVMFETGFVTFMGDLFETCGTFVEHISVHVCAVYAEEGTHEGPSMLRAVSKLAKKVMTASTSRLRASMPPIKLSLSLAPVAVHLENMLHGHQCIVNQLERAAASLEML